MTASRCSDDRVRWAGGLAAAGLALALGPIWATAEAQAQAPGQEPGERASRQVRALERQADTLLAEEGALLAQLRGFEIERQQQVEDIAQAERDRTAAEEALAAAAARRDALQRTAVAEQPEIAARLVRVYKAGRTGFWRSLLDMEHLQSANRAYRTAAALTRIDHDRVTAHQRTLDAVAADQALLRQQVAAIAAIASRAALARDAAARAVASRAALVATIDSRRDLNAQLTGELQTAQRRLQASLTRLGGEAATPLILPLRPFQGALPWPARGRILSRFGPPTERGAGPAVGRSGMVIALLEGQQVRAVHEGTVAYAAPFTGYGNLVIVQHGDRSYSLYGHLEALRVTKGAHVAALTPLGTSGTDPGGNPALYFELRVDGRAVDPLQWLVRE